MEDPIPLRNLTKFIAEKALTVFTNSEDEESRALIWDSAGGCTDAFSIFGILAFFLAIFDLILDLYPIKEGRRLHDAQDYYPSSLFTLKEDEAVSAVYSALRGFINGVSSGDHRCFEQLLCEGFHEAEKTGPIGKAVHAFGILKATQLFSKLHSTYYGSETLLKSTMDLKSRWASFCSESRTSCAQQKRHMYPGIFKEDFIGDLFP